MESNEQTHTFGQATTEVNLARGKGVFVPHDLQFPDQSLISGPAMLLTFS